MITLDTATALETLALSIFNPNIVPNSPATSGLGAAFNPALYTGIKGEDSAIDAQLVELIAPVMLMVDGRELELGFQYTLNITCALKLRPKHWYLQGLDEFVPSVLPPCNVGFICFPTPTGLTGDHGSYGFTLGTAMCAAICKNWATTIRLWLAGNYPMAVNPPSPT